MWPSLEVLIHSCLTASCRAGNINSGRGLASLGNLAEWDINATGREKVILSYPRWTETRSVWLPTKKSYFLGKLEAMADFKKLPVSHAERAANKANSWRGGEGPSSDEDDE